MSAIMQDTILILKCLRAIMRALLTLQQSDELLHELSAVEDRIRELERKPEEPANA